MRVWSVLVAVFAVVLVHEGAGSNELEKGDGSKKALVYVGGSGWPACPARLEGLDPQGRLVKADDCLVTDGLVKAGGV